MLKKLATRKAVRESLNSMPDEIHVDVLLAEKADGFYRRSSELLDWVDSVFPFRGMDEKDANKMARGCIA